MATRRLSWLLSALCSLVFLALYQKWLAWLVTGAVLLVPLFSLLISLPAMLGARLTLELPQHTRQGEPLELPFTCKGSFPTPMWKCRVEAVQPLSGLRYRLHPGDLLPTHHCGTLQCRLKRVRIYDYLGIFSLPLRGQRAYRVTVMPIPVPLPTEQVLSTEKICTFKPKPGGFAEHHDLRIYRSGDDVRQIHWKLSAKTGKLIIREPMVPNPGRVLIRLVLRGTREQLDRMLGRAVWLGQKLLEQGFPFELHALTGDGVRTDSVATPQQLVQALERLLSSTPAEDDAVADQSTAAWVYEIGGEPDEEA